MSSPTPTDAPGATVAGASSGPYEVVRLAARAGLGAAQARALREAVAEVADWNEVLRLAAFHRTSPTLYSHLRDHTDAPKAVIATLRAQTRLRSAHALFLSAEMAEVGRRLDADGIRYLVLKGPSLTEAYGDVSLRQFSDNDLLIRREDFRRVETALLDIGFMELKRGDRQQQGYLAVHGEYPFGRPGPLPSTVDLHTRLVPFGYAYRPRFGTLAERSRPLDVAGYEAPALSWGDLFLVLCVNALKDQWNRLRLVTDVAEVARFVEDWPAVERRAERHQSLRALRLAVLLAADVVGGAFPDGVLARARSDRRAVRLARYVEETLPDGRAGEVRSGMDRVWLNLDVQDGLRGRARYVCYAAARRLTEKAFAPGNVRVVGTAE